MTVNFSTWKGITDGQTYGIPDILLEQHEYVWLFNEGSGAETQDQNNEESISLDSPSWEFGAGFEDTFLLFNGNDDLGTTDLPELSTSQSEYTVNAWVRPTIPQNGYLFSTDDGTGNLLIYYEGDDIAIRAGSGSDTTTLATNPFVSGEWQMHSMSYDGSTARHYRNGDEFDDTSHSGDPYFAGMVLGNRSQDSKDRPYDGGMAMFGISKTQQSASTISDIYDETEQFFD